MVVVVVVVVVAVDISVVEVEIDLLLLLLGIYRTILFCQYDGFWVHLFALLLTS
jgi:hypothetical protein